MEGWNYWEGRKVYIRLKSGRSYSGKVIEVDERSIPLIFITIIDKFDNRVSFSHAEIEVIQEEK